MKELYFDHASTSYPKHPRVIESIQWYLTQIGVSPGRSSYKRALAAEEMILETRTLLAKLFNAKFAHQIVFTLNATHALNIAIQGLLVTNDHVIITNYEHNAVLRPLEELRIKKNITYDVLKLDSYGNFIVDNFEKLIKPNTKLIIANHGSNVIGSLSPITLLGGLAKKHKLLFLVDASQTAGLITIDVEQSNIDFLAFTGHKSLLGPSGVGGLYVRNSESLKTFYQGGTGTNSISLMQPETMPVKFEAGTINYLGIAGLLGALKYLIDTGINDLLQDKIKITIYCLSQLKEIPELIIYGDHFKKDLPIISFNIIDKLPSEVSFLLDRHDIMVRSGLQCAPLIHKTIRTFPHGTVRLSFGYKNTIEEIDYFMKILKQIILQ